MYRGFPLDEKSFLGSETGLPPAGTWWRYPPTAAGIQVNHCKNPLCANFGIPPRHRYGDLRGKKLKGDSPVPGDYRVIGVSAGSGPGTSHPLLQCDLCGATLPMQSNLAIAEELLRIGRYLDPATGPACTNEDCACYQVPQSANPSNYVGFGTNKAGTPRYRCQTCRKVFSFGGKPTKRQRETHRNIDIFKHLVNKHPLSRIVATLDITMPLLYRRIDFIWRQCRAFAGERERALIESGSLGRRHICIDRQMLTVNWASRKDRRNVALWGTGSADLDSSYVFGMHLNYEPDLDEAYVREDMLRYGDHELKQPFRRYARVWLPADYERASAARMHQLRKVKAEDGLDAAIDATYDQALRRDDIEAGLGPDKETRTPAKGMLVHEQISMNAHLFFLAGLLRNAEKVRAFMDQESGLRAAFMNAFGPRVRDRTADAFYVAILKETTVDKKRQAVNISNRRFKEAKKRFLGKSDYEVMLALVLEEIQVMRPKGKWADQWLFHPLPNMAEPDKRVCWLTDVGDYDEERIARLYLKATLHPIDRYFMQVRRRISLAERGISSSANQGRIWHGYSAYDPSTLMKLLEIFRVFYNYCEHDTKDKMTPAMRLGLAKGLIKPSDVLYFS